MTNAVAPGSDLAFDSASPIWIVDDAQRVTYMNDAAREFFGLPRDERVIGRPCFGIVQGRQLDGVQHCQANCTVISSARQGTPHPVAKLLLPTIDMNGSAAVDDPFGDFDRQWSPCEVQHVTMRAQDDANGDGTSVLHIARDLTRMEKVLRFSDEVLAAARRFIGTTTAENPMRRLTPQERRVLAALAEGHDTTAVAEQLGVSKSTVRNHTQHILKKLECHSRLEAVAMVQPFLAGESIRNSERALDLIDS